MCKRKSYPFKILLGYTKRDLYGSASPIYLEGFKWDCDWYWGGGYVGNSRMHCHFDGCFLETVDPRGHPLGHFVTPWYMPDKHIKDIPAAVVNNGCSVWCELNFFLDNSPEHLRKNWWRIKDLYKQFYIFKAAAEAFRYGGHCASAGRTPNEIKPEMEKAMNDHIEFVIIPEIVKIMEGAK